VRFKFKRRQESQEKPVLRSKIPPWEPTEKEAQQINYLAGTGLDEGQIASILSVTEERLLSNPTVQATIKSARTKAVALVHGKVFEDAQERGNISSKMLFLQLQAARLLERNKEDPEAEDILIGRPTEYTSAYNEYAFRHCLLGATNEELADLFGVNLRAIGRWMVRYPSFRHAIYKGRAGADAKVANALYHSAIGYKMKDMHVSSNHLGQVTQTPIIRKYPPNVAAMQIWLRNRHRSKWSAQENDTEAQQPSDQARVVRKFLAEIEEVTQPLVEKGKPKLKLKLFKRKGEGE